jgi:hypothetical protein
VEIVAYRVLVRELEVRRPLGRLRHRRKDNIKVDLRVDLGGRRMIKRNAFVNAVMNLRIP